MYFAKFGLVISKVFKALQVNKSLSLAKYKILSALERSILDSNAPINHVWITQQATKSITNINTNP